MELVVEKYKQTEIGVIPKDWEVKTISEFTTPVRGGSPRPAGDPKYFNGNFIPWLTVASLTNIPISQIFVSETDNYLTETGSFHSRILEKETLIIANSGATLGVAKLLSIKCCANDGIAALLDFDTNISKFYVVYFINTKIKYLREVVATGNGQPNLNTDLIGKIQIPLPPTLAEQTAVATALSDADALITGLEKLIAKKRNIKQGAMQRLLKPKEGWEVKTLGEIGKFSKGQGIRKDEAQSGEIPCVRYGELYTKHNDYIKVFYSFLSKEISQTSRKLKFGDILFAGSGETKKEIGKCVAFIDDLEVYAGSDIVILSPLNQCSLFLGFLLNTPIIQKQKANRGQGDAVVHISATQLGEISISIPSLSEQTRIATILSDMDAELTTLEQKLEKYKKIKLGMMQELLTGRTRLV